MIKVERKKRNIWNYHRISSIIIFSLALVGIGYCLNVGINYAKTKNENKKLKAQRAELLQEYQLYQDLISEQNYQIIIQDNGYCLDTTNNLIYKCQE